VEESRLTGTTPSYRDHRRPSDKAWTHDRPRGTPTGTVTSARGVEWGTMANGDKYFVRYQGTATAKEGAPPTISGTWSFTGGTGKLKGPHRKRHLQRQGQPRRQRHLRGPGRPQTPVGERVCHGR
jgi:hypothetical protein